MGWNFPASHSLVFRAVNWIGFRVVDVTQPALSLRMYPVDQETEKTQLRAQRIPGPQVTDGEGQRSSRSETAANKFPCGLYTWEKQVIFEVLTDFCCCFWKIGWLSYWLLFVFSRKRCERVLSKNVFIADHQPLTKMMLIADHSKMMLVADHQPLPTARWC